MPQFFSSSVSNSWSLLLCRYMYNSFLEGTCNDIPVPCAYHIIGYMNSVFEITISDKIVQCCTIMYVKDIHANCFCASLLRTQIHMPHHALSACAKY